MRLKDEPKRLVMWNSPRLHWPLAVLLVTAGGCALLVTAGLVSGARPYTAGARVVAGAVGTLALALGAWLCWRAPLSALVVDRVGRTVTLTRRGLLNTVEEQIPLDAVVDARVTKERDGKGSPRYRVELVLDSGSIVPVPLIRPADRHGCMRAAEHLWKALELPRA
jgi:hypothetical protein